MPRVARLDAPGILHHVRGRGIERRKIFLNDFDYRDFLARLEYACADGAASLYAFCLMPNHFHLSIRTGERPLATTMRKLLTAYATSFNRRNKRDGHLFQNRYKSTVVDDEQYFLGLLRYIHLNPVRARLVDSVDALKEYPWCGYGVLMGRQKLAAMETDEVLGRFGTKAGPARRQLVAFMASADAKSEQKIFKGGGLVRSAGGMDALKDLARGEKWAYDERILGCGAFVESVLRQAEPERSLLTVTAEEKQHRFEKLVERICELTQTSTAELTGGGRRRSLVTVRRALCFIAVRRLGITAAAVARMLNISAVAVMNGVDGGTSSLGADLKLTRKLQILKEVSPGVSC